ncbi:hypothetical protein D3C77_550950 [compost metagenome]
MPALAVSAAAANCSIRCMLWRTTCWPESTFSSAAWAACAASSALRATSCTVAVICCMAVATCSVSSFWLPTSRLVCSVTADSACALPASCSMPCCKPLTMPDRPAAICCMACISCPTSSRRGAWASKPNSPAAMRWARAITCLSGPTTARVISQAASTPTSSANAVAKPMATALRCSSPCRACCCPR